MKFLMGVKEVWLVLGFSGVRLIRRSWLWEDVRIDFIWTEERRIERYNMFNIMIYFWSLIQANLDNLISCSYWILHAV